MGPAPECPELVKFEERACWSEPAMPLSEHIGWNRAQLGRLRIESAPVNIVPLTHAQSSAFDVFEAERIFVGLEGVVEFLVGYDSQSLEPFRLSQFDRLFVPTKIGHDYTNHGSGSAKFLSIPRPADDKWLDHFTYSLAGEDAPSTWSP
jgi:hypothetical protein